MQKALGKQKGDKRLREGVSEHEADCDEARDDDAPVEKKTRHEVVDRNESRSATPRQSDDDKARIVATKRTRRKSPPLQSAMILPMSSIATRYDSRWTKRTKSESSPLRSATSL